MIGRKVTAPYHRITGEVVKWEPLGFSMCDALVREESGRVCWYSSSDLHPIDDGGPLPSRAEAREKARLESLASLRAIREQLIKDWHKPWPGAEHGKAIVGQSIDGAIRDLSKGESR